MAVIIRFACVGAQRNAVYRIVAAEQRFKRDGRFLEHLGTFTPFANSPLRAMTVLWNMSRIKRWIAHGAILSDAVQKLLQQSGEFPANPRLVSESIMQVAVPKMSVFVDTYLNKEKTVNSPTEQ